jgi:hypothetical protein
MDSVPPNSPMSYDFLSHLAHSRIAIPGASLVLHCSALLPTWRRAVVTKLHNLHIDVLEH